jgi:hypothetical protein
MVRIIFLTGFGFFFWLTDVHTQTNNKPIPKIITATVSSNGKTSIGGVNFSTDSLAAQLNKKMWSSYLSTGKMYDSINVKFSGEVHMGARGSALDAIINGMQKTLNDLCQEKYNASFENLDPAMQDKIRKQYPVFFQELHW